MRARRALLAALPLLAAAAPPPLPDLRPLVVVGSNGHIIMRIANRGTAPAPAGVVRVVLGAPINTAHNYPEPALAPGEIKSVTINVGKPLAGVHYAVRVDGVGAIAESNEANNVMSGNF